MLFPHLDERQRRLLMGAEAQVLATVLHLRKIGTHDLLARLFGVTGSTLTRAVQVARPLFDEHDLALQPSTVRFRIPTDAAAHLDQYGSRSPKKIKPAC
ncbi:hypothetical protein ACJWDR_19020 [Streptomyces tauricus]|uniref:hypothetical protein n=1 Tax=Streptomyces tauricus TaxID=68274 RepID=UPI00387EFCC1